MGARTKEFAKTQRIGVVVDKRYRIVGRVGRGASASVYGAEHLVLRRFVALKVLPPQPRLSNRPRRFEREAFAAARARHPNCVDVYDHGELPDGSRYMVMELLDGETLAERMAREKRLDPAQALHIARHVLRGLDSAHCAGIVHRDLKPSNINIAPYEGDPNHARLLDFGLAKLVDEALCDVDSRAITEVGLTVGTPLYICPEQALGEDVDCRADIYAMGAVLFEMITGRPPFTGPDKLEVLCQHIRSDVPYFAEVSKDLDVPVEVEAIVRRALAKKRDFRFASARAFLDAIATLLPDDGYVSPNDEVADKAVPSLILPELTGAFTIASGSSEEVEVATVRERPFGVTCEILEVEMTDEEYLAWFASCDLVQ